MTELQSKLLEMMGWLHNFITSHGLRYYIYAGTLLGALRHQGFIPWDDDIDIVMPRNDYEKLCELLKNPIDHYVIESATSPAKDFLYTFAKFYDTHTTMTEYLNHNIKRGVYIDILPLDGLGNTKEEAVKAFNKIDKLNILLNTRICAYRKERKWYKNCAIFLGRLIPSFLVDNKKLVVKIDTICKSRDFDEYQYYCLAMSSLRKEGILNKDILGKPTEYKFENLTLYGPEKAEEYLTKTYGDWRQLPPENRRQHVHDFIELDFNKSYLEKT